MSSMPRMIAREIAPIKPYSTFEVPTKDCIYKKMANFGCFSIGCRKGSKFSGYVPYGGGVRDNVVYVFSAEKVRAKWDHKKVKAKDGTMKMDSTQIRRAHWVVRVFKFDLDQVVNIEQGSRTFRAVIK